MSNSYRQLSDEQLQRALAELNAQAGALSQEDLARLQEFIERLGGLDVARLLFDDLAEIDDPSAALLEDDALLDGDALFAGEEMLDVDDDFDNLDDEALEALDRELGADDLLEDDLDDAREAA